MQEIILTAGVTALLVVALPGGIADAHSNEANLAVTCATPDPGRPLIEACTAALRYSDGDPVEGARLVVVATREGPGGAALDPVPFEPLGKPGVYSAIVEFPAYGTWRMRFVLREPAEGEAELRDEILPPVPGASSEIRAQLQIVFKFGLADVRNLALRFAHVLGVGAWFGSVALVLLATTLVAPEERPRLLRRGAAAFPWAAGGSLVLVAVSGILNAVYNTPTRPPGLFAPGSTAKLPFGEVYLGTFLLKMVLVVAAVWGTAALSVALRHACREPASMVADGTVASRLVGPERRVWRIAALDLGLGVLILAVVVVMAYFHIISHVGGAAGAS
ncbi:MAG: hypothetical protein HYU54_04220 [Actinobacteria bacterium]|nr:hypothetical protein [Actinomycetota bacterium]